MADMNFGVLSEIQDKVDEAKAALHKKASAEGEALLKVSFKEFFKTYPVCTAVVWTQYTPYFMDGDPCEFSMNEVHFRLKNIGFEDYEGGTDAYSIKALEADGKVPKGTYKGLDKIGNQLQAMSDVMHTVFGDHVQVVCTPESIEAEEFNHD